MMNPLRWEEVEMPHRKPALEKIIKDLENLVEVYCDVDDHVSEACNDASLMLQEAYDELEKNNSESI